MAGQLGEVDFEVEDYECGVQSGNTHAVATNWVTGDGIDNFWKVLEEGKNCTVEIPPERFNAKEWYDPDDNKPGKICTTRAALLDEFNSFDNHLFGINNMEAERMDPQQKLLIECTYKALEDAGVPVEAVSGTKTGVFVVLKLRQETIKLPPYPLLGMILPSRAYAFFQYTVFQCNIG
ncbi:hypothetical protein BTVI_148015 [Pitangus sulphuratus]|nr:hypothetical protein BTVI_148015 [Pitangus sulphuratus]